MTPPSETTTTTAPDPLAAFQAMQQSAAESPHYTGSVAQGLRSKCLKLRGLITDLASGGPEELRAEIVALLRTLSWPVRTGTTDQPVLELPLTLTLEKEELIRRLWRQDSAGIEADRRWSTDARVVFYCALHGPETFRRFYSDLPGQLVAVYDFYREQITSDPEKDLLILAMDVLWEGHRVNMAVPAPAPFGAHTSGN